MWNWKTFSPWDHKIKALVFWDSWTGKTTFWWTAKNAVFLSAEWGLLSLKWDVPMYEIKSLNDLKSALIDLKNEIKEGTCPFDTVIIDSITEINDIIRSWIEKDIWDKSMTFKERWELSSIMQSILRSFRDLPLHVLFIAHEKSEKDDDRLIKFKPSLNWKAADSICYYMDIVWYTSIQKTEEGVKFSLVVEPKPYAPTKCRWNYINDKTTADFEVWKKIIQKNDSSKKTDKKEDVSDKAEDSEYADSDLLKDSWLDPSFELWLWAIKKIKSLDKDDVHKWIDDLKKQIDSSKKLSKEEKKGMNNLADKLLTIC